MSSEKSSIRVCVRVRPLSSREAADGARVAVRCSDRTVAVVDPVSLQLYGGDSSAAPAPPLRTFAFDAVLAPGSQSDTYAVVGAPLLESALAGYNSALFAYGPTGTGKTHTMLGASGVLDPSTTPDLGVIPRLCGELFSRLGGGMPTGDVGSSLSPATADTSVSVLASYYQIYCETVSDLLAAAGAGVGDAGEAAGGPHRQQQQQQPSFHVGAGRRRDGGGGGGSAGVASSGGAAAPGMGGGGGGLRVREHPATGPFIDGLTLVPVASYADVEKLLVAGR
jgi:hypothetical protein